MAKSKNLFDTLVDLYHKRLENNLNAHEEIADILEEMKPIHKADAIARGITDTEQSWRAWKGKNYEKFVRLVLCTSIEKNLPLKVVEGSKLERKAPNKELSMVKRNVLVDFGVHGCFVPDADIVVYSPDDKSVKAIISCKVSLRERVAQTGYWSLKLKSDPVTADILMFFATMDGDGDFLKDHRTKGTAIAMQELDAVYVLSEEVVEEHNVKRLDKIIEDLSQ